VKTDLQRSLRGEQPYLKLLYLTPERIVKSDATRELLDALYQNEFLARFVIDEAHCVSSWGHDFRKEYGALSILKRDFPETKIVALTATARTKVAADTQKILCIEACKKFATGWDRPNLFFSVRDKPGRGTEALQKVLDYVQHPSRTHQTGIVYSMTRKETEEMASFLRRSDISADYYHAGQVVCCSQRRCIHTRIPVYSYPGIMHVDPRRHHPDTHTHPLHISTRTPTKLPPNRPPRSARRCRGLGCRARSRWCALPSLTAWASTSGTSALWCTIPWQRYCFH